jgi:L-2-hydroxycarboxylate dehydrogenase (NAD+)
MLKLPLDELRRSTEQALRRVGHSAGEVESILDVLTYAQLRGNYQSIVQWAALGVQPVAATGPLAITNCSEASALIDGRQNNGVLVLLRATDLAVDKAVAGGAGIVGTCNTSTSTGPVGYYARRIAEAGFVGFVFSGSSKKVAHTGSSTPVYGTNPISAGIPSTSNPIVLDLATSAIPRYHVVEASLLGHELPRGAALGPEGGETVDPREALRGALLPFGGHKGSALAFLVEVLTGPLVGGGLVGTADADGNWGNLAIAVDPSLLAGRDNFAAGVSRLRRSIENSSPTLGTEQILLPGERGDRLATECRRRGYVEIDEELWRRFQEALQQPDSR